MKNTIRILVCDDHHIVRNGLIKILREKEGIFIVGESENGQQMVEKYRDLKPDLILADISMPVMSGLDAAKIILKEFPDAQILFLSVLYDEQYVYFAYKIGAMGLLSKTVTNDELTYAISEIQSGRKYFGPDFNNDRLKSLLKKYENIKITDYKIAGSTLTDREEQILKLISQGCTSEEISNILPIGKRTIDSIRSSIMRKFELNSLPALISFAIHFVESKNNVNVTIDFNKTDNSIR